MVTGTLDHRVGTRLPPRSSIDVKTVVVVYLFIRYVSQFLTDIFMVFKLCRGWFKDF